MRLLRYLKRLYTPSVTALTVLIWCPRQPVRSLNARVEGKKKEKGLFPPFINSHDVSSNDLVVIKRNRA